MLLVTELISFFFVQVLLLRDKRIGLAVEKSGNPVFECKKCDLRFSERDHVACSQGSFLDTNVWNDFDVNQKLLKIIQVSLRNVTRDQDTCDACVCVNCLEVVEQKIFRSRKSSSFPGWGYLSVWKDNVVGIIPRDMCVLGRHMWTDCVRDEAYYGLVETGNEAKKKGTNTVDGGNSTEVDNRIPEDIIRQVLSLGLNEEETDGSANEITRTIETRLGKSEGDLLQFTNSIAHLCKSSIQVKEVTQRHLQDLPYDLSRLTLTGVVSEVFKKQELKNEILKNRIVWESKIKDWIIEFNKELDGNVSISPNKVMMAFFRTRGHQDWYKCRVVRQDPCKKGDLAVRWEVEWEDGDSTDRMKYRWQFKECPQDVSVSAAAEDAEGILESSASSLAAAAETAATVLSSLSAASETAATATAPATAAAESSASSSLAPAAETETAATASSSLALASDDDRVRVLTKAYKMARVHIGTATALEKVNYHWDFDETCHNVVSHTLSLLRQEFVGEMFEGVIMDLEYELWESVHTWVGERLKVVLVGMVTKVVKKKRNTSVKDCESFSTVVNQSLQRMIKPEILKRYKFLILDVVRKQWLVDGIVEEGEQGCSQDLDQTREASSRMRSRSSMPDTRYSRFHKDKDKEVLKRVLGTDAQYLVYLSREQLRAMTCANHIEFHKFLIRHQNQESFQEPGERKPWNCSHCHTEHDAGVAVCPQNWEIRSPWFMNRENRVISCPFVVDNKTARLFYDSDEGQTYIRALGLPKNNYEIDHIIPVAHGGACHPMNLCILSPGANRYFSSDKSKHEDKMKLLGGVAKLCAEALKEHQTTFWNVSGLHRHPRVDLANFRVLESAVDLVLDPGLTFSPYMFVFLPPEEWLKVQLCNTGVDTWKGSLEYVQGFEVESLNKTTYLTRGGGEFVRSQHRQDLEVATNQMIEIEVRPMKFGLWGAKEVCQSRYQELGVDDRHLPSGW